MIKKASEVPIQFKKLVSVEIAAGMLDTSPNTIKALVKAGLLQKMMLRSESKFWVKELDRFCEEALNKQIDLSAPVDEILKDLR